MSKENVIFVDIKYPLDEPKNYIINSNARMPVELLEEYMRALANSGEDNRKSNALSEYHIRVEFDVSEDTFTATSDCGNFGLRDGIIFDVIQRLNA